MMANPRHAIEEACRIATDLWARTGDTPIYTIRLMSEILHRPDGQCQLICFKNGAGYGRVPPFYNKTCTIVSDPFRAVQDFVDEP